MMDGNGVHSKNIPGTYRPIGNKDNDYLIDRDAQRRGETYSGIAGIASQDAAMQESMGPIVDRTKERLAATDAGIIKARAKLRKAAIALRENGTTPPGVNPSHHRVRSASVVLPQDQSYIEAVSDKLRVQAGVGQLSV